MRPRIPLRNYLSDLDQFHDYLCPRNSERRAADIDIHQIDHITIREYMAKLYEDKRKKSSIARKLATLRTFFKFLCREQVLESNPARLVSSPRLEKRLPRLSRSTRSSSSSRLPTPRPCWASAIER